MLTAFRRDDARRWQIAVIDGPNMPNLGARDEKVYGPIRSMHELQALVRTAAESIGVDVVQTVSNYEGEILEFIHHTAQDVQGYVINPAGLTTYGEATRHALSETRKPVVEVHFSNTARKFTENVPPYLQQHSRFTYSATGLVMGLRQYSYLGALLALTLALDDECFLYPGDTQQPA
jgi:3-dehydroquinate dehydratase-2